MSDFDVLMNSEELKSRHNIELPCMIVRYRDDIFVIWLHEVDKLYDLLNFMNSLYHNIRFTMSVPSAIEKDFLNIWVYRKDNKLQTKPFSKPCDNHQYLNPTSCHPSHTLKNIPYCIAYSVFKITSEPSEYIKAKAEFSSYLSDRGYSMQCIKESLIKWRSLIGIQ